MKEWILLVFSLLFMHISYAQVNADFSVDNSEGCSPLRVSFTNQSTGNNLSYDWDFGNGNSSVNENPEAFYTNPGTYTVELTVSDGVDSDSYSMNVTVFESPVADFSAPRKGCAPYTVTFQNASQIGDAPINSFVWDFRTGEIDNSENPQVTYNEAGTYTVFLEITDENGCKSSIERSAYIDVANAPEAKFSLSPQESCNIPETVSFIDQSTGKGEFTYAWDFGDGGSSTESDPEHTYEAAGTFTVNLTIDSEYGCSDNASAVFKGLKAVPAEGRIKQNGEVLPSSGAICAGEISFFSDSDEAGSVFWNFGDGGYSYAETGTYTFNEAGEYTVKLITNPGSTCASTKEWNFTVEKAKADFSMNINESCQDNAFVSLTDMSTDAMEWTWYFDETQVSTSNNVVDIIPTPDFDDPYAENREIYVPIRLEIINSNGCPGEKIKNFRYYKPTARFTVDKTSGCAPLTVNFTDNSLSENDITSYEWNFGDGTGSGKTTSHTYNTAGEYLTSVTITDSDGCSAESYTILIKVGKKLTPDFDVTPATVCSGESFQINDITGGGDKDVIDQWKYWIENDEVENPHNASDVTADYIARPGSYAVKQLVSYNGCVSDTLKKSGLLTLDGPDPTFELEYDCEQAMNVRFNADLDHAGSFTWSFGDGQTNSTDQQPVHQYNNAGNYTVTLEATSGDCTYSFQKTAVARTSKAVIDMPASACAGEELAFYGNNSYEQVDYCEEKYFWNVNNGELLKLTNDDSITYVAESAGSIPVLLTTHYDNGCVDTATQNISFIKPNAKFQPDNKSGCTPFIVNFEDQSTVNSGSIEQYNWTFGDGMDTTYNVPLTDLDHLYTVPGIFPVSLEITDDQGCKDTHQDTIRSSNPDAGFTISDPLACKGQILQFEYAASDFDSLRWRFKEGIEETSVEKPYEFVYQDTGKFVVSLSIYKDGCGASTTDTVSVQKADASFAVSDSVWNCYPKLIEFDYQGNPDEVADGTWFFDYEEKTSEFYPSRVFNYALPGEYHARLEVTTTNGCVENASKKILITGPTGSFTMSPNPACVGDEVTYQLKDTANVFDYEWDLGDGNLITGDPVNIVYNEREDFFPKLILYGDEGKCIPPPKEDTLMIYKVNADFRITNDKLCEGKTIAFENLSFDNVTNNWNFGNGTLSSEIHPVIAYETGDYNVSLTVENEAGCNDVYQKTITIDPLPDLRLPSDTLICVNDQIDLTVSGGDVISWFPPTGLSDTSAFSLTAHPSFSTTYSVAVTDTLTGCINEGALTIDVQQKPSAEVRMDTHSIVVGDQVYLYADSLSWAIAEWSPAELVECVNCYSTYARPLEDETFVLTLQDTNQCFSEDFFADVAVRESYTVAMPTAFIPGDANGNSQVKVKGHGIKELIEFSIYNRWGNRIFSTNQLDEGWDGTFNGKVQNSDTYTYIVKVIFWNGEEKLKKGTISLLR